VKVEGRLFLGIGVFLWIVSIIYGDLTREFAGTTALVLCGGLCMLIALYLFSTGRRMGVRPEDDPNGEIDEGAGEYGFFSPHSWWPLPVALSAAITFFGLVFGLWISLLGAVLLLASTFGLVFEYYRGYHTTPVVSSTDHISSH